MEAAFRHRPRRLDPVLGRSAVGFECDRHDLRRRAIRARRQELAGALVVVDGVQALPHFAITIDPAIDLAFFSAYKVYAPHMGFWYLSAARPLIAFLAPDDAQPSGGDPRFLDARSRARRTTRRWPAGSGRVEYLSRRDRTDAARSDGENRRLRRGRTRRVCPRERFAERTPRNTFGSTAGRRSAGRLPLFAFNVNGVAERRTSGRASTAPGSKRASVTT